jgi:hypothetical protein
MVIVGVVGLLGVIGFLLWVVSREPWGPRRDRPRDLRAEGERRRRTLAHPSAHEAASSTNESR